MITRRLVPREQAEQDVDAAIDYYLSEAGDRVASRFLDAVQAAFRSIAEHAEAGSPALGEHLRLPGLRTWPVRNHPYLVIYIVAGTTVDVWRVLHAQRDIPAHLDEPKD